MCIRDSLKSKDYPELLQNFINSGLAEPYREVESQMDAEKLLQRQSQYPAMTVPTGAAMLTGGVDVQRKSFYWTVRAWMPNMTSFNVAHGQAFTWMEIEQVMNAWYRDHAGGRYQVSLGVVDSGYQTDDVYKFCAINREWAVPRCV